MKRQLGIVALIACIILVTVPTAFCADKTTVTVTDTNTVIEKPTYTYIDGKMLKSDVTVNDEIKKVKQDKDKLKKIKPE